MTCPPTKVCDREFERRLFAATTSIEDSAGSFLDSTRYASSSRLVRELAWRGPPSAAPFRATSSAAVKGHNVLT